MLNRRTNPPGFGSLEPVMVDQPDHPRLAAQLLTILQKERDMRAESLVKASAKDYAEYRWYCGIIEGLDLAIASAKEAKKKAEA